MKIEAKIHPLFFHKFSTVFHYVDKKKNKFIHILIIRLRKQKKECITKRLKKMQIQ